MRKIERGAVVRLQDEETDHQRVEAAEQLLEVDEVFERLAHYRHSNCPS